MSIRPAVWLEHLHAWPAPARLSGSVALLLLAAVLTFLLPGFVSAAQLQLLLLAVVLLAAVLFGLAAGLIGATLAFGLMLWRAVEPAAEGGWTLGFRPVLDAFLWFAVAKLAAALAAAPRRLAMRLSEAGQTAEADARRQELLLSELSHRVQNDLHSLVAMLEMQAAADPEASEALHAAARRVLVLGQVHGRLSRGKEPEAVVDSHLFLEGLVADLRAGIDGLRPVALTVDAEAHPLPLARAGDIGLVVNELVTNALKHAFPGDKAGVVRVGFHRDGDAYEVVVADNGVGTAAAPGRPARDDGGLGNRILHALAVQLGGRLVAARGEVGGTVCRMRFPIPPAPASRKASPPAVAVRGPVADGHRQDTGPGRIRGSGG